jgi:hypothetical protein
LKFSFAFRLFRRFAFGFGCRFCLTLNFGLAFSIFGSSLALGCGLGLAFRFRRLGLATLINLPDFFRLASFFRPALGFFSNFATFCDLALFLSLTASFLSDLTALLGPALFFNRATLLSLTAFLLSPALGFLGRFPFLCLGLAARFRFMPRLFGLAFRFFFTLATDFRLPALFNFTRGLSQLSLSFSFRPLALAFLFS